MEAKKKMKVIWKGRPSHYEYFMKYCLVALLAILGLSLSLLGGLHLIGMTFFGFSLLLAVYLYLDIKMTNFTLTEEALLSKKGIFTRKTDELMLYRIQDISMEEPFFLRLVKLSNLKIYSMDNSDPIFYLTSLKDGEKVRKALRILSEKQRNKLGVRPVDIVRNQ